MGSPSPTAVRYTTDMTRTFLFVLSNLLMVTSKPTKLTIDPTVRPIAILKSAFTGPQNGNYAYNFETENGISQDVEGRMKMVEDSPVYVMQGTYSYIGTDGNTWKVEWYADETGYHPSAPFLPKSVVPDHPEVAAAASVNNEVFTLPEAGLAGYGEDHQGAATELLDSYTSFGNSLIGVIWCLVVLREYCVHSYDVTREEA